MPATQAPTSEADDSKTVRLHITPLKPELLKVYLPPSVLPLARNISYHTVETFPEKGFGYLELPEQEAQKIRKKLNGTTLKGSKVRIDMAKPEKRKVREEADAEDKPAKRSKKDKKEKKEKKDKSEKRQRSPGVFDGVELPADRKVKRGWTEPTSVKTKSSKDKKDKKSKDDKHQSKPSKYTKEPELLFKAKLEPVAATEHSRKEKKKDKKEKKERKTKTKEVTVHEFEKNTKTPSFLKVAKVSTEKKPPVDYVDGVGWVDEDGVVVEPETKKAAHSRVLQLVDGQPLKEPPPTDSQGRPIVKKDAPKPAKKERKKRATPPPESSESELDDESSVVSSSSEDEDSSDPESSASDSDSESDTNDKAKAATSPIRSPAQHKPASTSAPTSTSTSTSAPATIESKEVHPLEALFKRAPPTLSTPTKPPPINTTFSFFDNATTSPPAQSTEATDGAPVTPFTQRDLEWRGLRSAAPTPDTAAIGRRFSFDWRKGSQEHEDDEEELSDAGVEAENQLSLNTRANQGGNLADVAEENEDEGGEGAGEGEGKKEDSEFRAWFWEHRGDINRAWKKRRREALKAKRQVENRKMTGRRVA
ncbi:hypothetical protein SVAN01_01444 [Stagonosporopsis vannaccii]|nr:hypothetical protein SVAN01_01444 [Stagonosporopsis vannaccii]